MVHQSRMLANLVDLIESVPGHCLSFYLVNSTDGHQPSVRKWARAWQNQQNDMHPPSLIRVFAVRLKKPWVLSYPQSAQRRLIRLDGCPQRRMIRLCGCPQRRLIRLGGCPQRRLIRLGGCPGWFESLLCALVILLVLLCLSSHVSSDLDMSRQLMRL